MLAVLAFIGFLALQVPGMGLDEEAHITHAEKLRQGHLASHDDKVSPELSSAVRCDRYRVFGSALNPGYPSGSRYECLSPQSLWPGGHPVKDETLGCVSPVGRGRRAFLLSLIHI